MLTKPTTKDSLQHANETIIRDWIAGLSEKRRQSDCIKLLYECGARQPLLIAPHWETFLALLKHKNNRLQWGAMIALSTITMEQHQHIFKALPQILNAAEKGTVITKDHAVKILVCLCSLPQYASSCFPLLHEQILLSPPNQFPSYAEQAMNFINEDNRAFFLKSLLQRLPDIESESKRKRVEKLIRKLRKDV
ncbi:MAG: hypothetical protein JST06_04365 [Bacteroidetes bacterium]|nr:hypothetical protein [Bacteroidota bacterium]MBS1630278.1 hypothetical protein [Bacteroidota bacterium]